MVGLFDFLFVRRSSGVRQKNIEKSGIHIIFGFTYVQNTFLSHAGNPVNV